MGRGRTLISLIKKKTFGNAALCGSSLIFFILFFLPSLSPAEKKVDVTDVSYWSYPDSTRVVITLSDNAEFTRKRLSNPDRLYFDIKDSRIKKEIKTVLPVANGMLKAVRAGQFNEGTVRIVLDLEKMNDYKVASIEDPVRIIIDVYGHSSLSGKSLSAKKRIVIDPGHGGHDPGAVGPNGLCEKDVVLDVGLKLKKILSENPDIEVYMTRDSDVFIPLVERTAIANGKAADLFVSIHANASPRKDAKGIETYFLNWTDDMESMKVAARENRISLKKMKSMKKEMDALDIELADLKRDHKRDESNKLANYIQLSMVNELHRNYSEIVDLKVKWAMFYVLFGAQMPSVLVEVSFVSNPLEERLLSKNTYRNDLAKSIASGIMRYISSSPETQMIAGIGKTGDHRD
jgi:N-acetylmuramoyl-L-alanine amidase